jgi:hypothetical protein
MIRAIPQLGRPFHLISALAIMMLTACERSQYATGGDGAKATDGNLVLAQSREVAANSIWDREFIGMRAGTLRISVAGAAPFSVALVSDAVYQSMVKESKRPEDFTSGVYVNSPSDADSFTTSCKLEQGKYWISISNKSPAMATFKLECHSW